MKFILTLSFNLIIPILTMSQSNFKQVVDELKRYQLINLREAAVLIKQQNEFQDYRKQKGFDYEEPDYSLAYNKLSILIDAKKNSTSGSSNGFSFTPAAREARKEPDEVIFNEVKAFIDKLSRSHLVTTETIQTLKEKNNKHLFVWEIEVANEAYRITNEEYFLKPEHFYKFLQALLKTDIIDEYSFQKLRELSANNALHQYEQIFPYFKRYAIIDLPKLPDNYEEFLQRLYENTSTVLPGLAFKKISFKDVIDKRESFDDFISHNLLVSFYVDNEKYSFSSFYDYESPNKKKSDNGNFKKIPSEYYQIFNKVLADNLSPYKLHSFNVNKNFIGIIALTEEQTKEVSWTYEGALSSYISVSYEDYSVKMTSAKINEALKFYDSIGLLSSLTPSKKDSSKEEVVSGDINSYTDILRKFDNVIVDLDAEYGVNDAQYKNITQQLISISNGGFAPTNIIDTYTYENKKFKYGFTLNEKTYLAELHQEDDWLDFNFWELIKQAVKEQNSDGKFYELAPTDGLTAIYLTNNQYKTFKEKKILEFANAE
jgi:hypothetical protein